MALRMVVSLRMAAIDATLAGFPFSSNRPWKPTGENWNEGHTKSIYFRCLSVDSQILHTFELHATSQHQ